MNHRETNFDFWYPRQLNDDTLGLHPHEHNVTHCVIGLCDTRATDDIRVSFDFERDGWMIEQETGNLDDRWTEVAFVKSFGSRPAA